MPDDRVIKSTTVKMFQDEFYVADMPGNRVEEKTIAGAPMPPDDFIKMFPELPYFGEGQDPQDLKARLSQLGALAGPMDAQDPVVTIVNPLDGNPQTNPNNTVNAGMTVGFTFLGQFIDHDLTFDPTPLSDTGGPGKTGRSAKFDLDSVYLGGPGTSPHLYDPANKARFLIDVAAPRDLPRNSASEAIIGDPRNDENVIISQLHLALLKFHNQVAEKVRIENPGWPLMQTFEEARRLVRWHYQYVVVEQFLRVTLDEAVFQDVYDHGPKYFTPPSEKMPREFQVAAYRFGHSQIRPGYKVNGTFGAPIFDIEIPRTQPDPNDLRGGHRAARRFVEWDTFFDFGTQEVGIQQGNAVVQPKVKPNKRIDPFLSTAMLRLPVAPGTVGVGEVNSLATRNLFRHIQHRLPSGQEVAKKIGAQSLTFPELAPLKFDIDTPLWYYVLGEALQQKQGGRLGSVGSRIVAEVFFCLLQSDPESYWHADRNWRPVLPAGRNPNYALPNNLVPFTMTDLLTFARAA